MKKKLFCILLSLMMVVMMMPMATMTAFADEQINRIEFTYQEWSVEQLKQVNNIKKLISVTNPSILNNYIDDSDNANSVGLFGEGNAQIGYYQFNTHNWSVPGRNISDVRPDEVKKVIISFRLINGDNVIPDLATSGTVSANGEELSDSYGDGYGSCYIWSTDGKSVYIQVAYEPVEEPSINWKKVAKGVAIGAGITAATVGTIHTVKAIKNYKAEKAVKDEPTVKEEQKPTEPTIDEVKEAVEAVTIRCNTKKAEDGTEVYTTVTDGDLEALEAAGYTVTYKFYRSKYAKKNYKLMETTANSTYTDTTGTEGTMYYYKAKVVVTDNDGNEVAISAIKDCKYGNRKF